MCPKLAPIAHQIGPIQGVRGNFAQAFIQHSFEILAMRDFPTTGVSILSYGEIAGSGRPDEDPVIFGASTRVGQNA